MDDVEAFCRALWRHDQAILAKLAGRVDPDAADRWGNTPLLSAARYGDLDLVSRLARRSADIQQGRVHLTPITYAARRGAADIVAFLRDKGAITSVVTAVHLGERGLLRSALRRDAALARLRDEEGSPILHHAVEALRPELVSLLIEHGATTADSDANGESALHRVADLRQAPPRPAAAMAGLLLDRGAAIDARNWDDVTPLHQAVRARNLAVATVLVERGADVNARDKLRGSTPLRRAVSGTGASGTAGTADVMVPLTRLLLAHGADPDAVDKRGVPVRASARAPEVVALFDAHPPRGLRAAPKRRVGDASASAQRKRASRKPVERPSRTRRAAEGAAPIPDPPPATRRRKRP